MVFYICFFYLFVWCAFFAEANLRWTGDAARDFMESDFDPAVGDRRNLGVFYVADSIPPRVSYSQDWRNVLEIDVRPDVGVPGAFTDQQGVLPISGWDIKRVWFQYNHVEDELNIGVDCFGVCGDADGDGDPSVASPLLTSLGGLDLPDLARAESVALVIDFDLNVADVLPSFVPDVNVPFDFVIGVPAGQPAGASVSAGPGDVSTLSCTLGKSRDELLNMANCFGIYEYQETTGVNIAARFLKRAQLNGQPWPVINRNPTVSAARPDLEWTIGAITELRALKGASFSRSRKEPWTLLMQGFSGSFVDDGIGEDFLPSQTNYVEVNFPCLEYDQCDICLGPNECDFWPGSLPNGGNGVGWDECDVRRETYTGTLSYSCMDCTGVPNGPAVYDQCDVCGGDGQTCVDCAGVPNGPAVYDQCDECNGDNQSCTFCGGVPNGPALLDQCDVCYGDDRSCADCAGVPNGPAVYDQCDVCEGDDQLCADCSGVPNGPAVYDRCDVCAGNNECEEEEEVDGPTPQLAPSPSSQPSNQPSPQPDLPDLPNLDDEMALIQCTELYWDELRDLIDHLKTRKDNLRRRIGWREAHCKRHNNNARCRGEVVIMKELYDTTKASLEKNRDLADLFRKNCSE